MLQNKKNNSGQKQPLILADVLGSGFGFHGFLLEPVEGCRQFAQRREVGLAEEVLARALEILQVVGVVDDPGMIRVLVVDLNRVDVRSVHHRADISGVTGDRIRPSPRLLMLTAALALGLAGCGESGTPSSSTEPAHQAQELQPAVPASPTGSAVAPPPVPRAPEAPASACRVSPLATLARTTRASRLTFLPSPLAGAAPLSGPALIVEGDTTELLRLSQSFTVMSSRTLTARFERTIVSPSVLSSRVRRRPSVAA